MQNISLNKITEQDDIAIAKLIRKVFEEFGIDRPGTVYTDPTTDHLSTLFQKEGSIYWIVKEGSEIVGGCGVFPTPGLPSGYAELVKYYLSQKARGKGIGKMLMEACIVSAKKLGYSHLYLESLPELQKAVSIYEKQGFVPLSKPLGNSGHFGCNIWMVKML